jgi:formylmethanofuran dehydrogenase subunit E
MTTDSICGIALDDFIIRMEEFHGYRSPGILLGGFMIEAALDKLGTTPYLNVISESVVCLPDAVQLLTPCTIGNGFLQLLDWGKFAITTYDRMTLAGTRASLDLNQINRFPLIDQWFSRSENKSEKPPFEELSIELIAAKDRLIVCRSVRLFKSFKESKRIATDRCKTCGESYALRLGSECPACAGQAYYRHDE